MTEIMTKYTALLTEECGGEERIDIEASDAEAASEAARRDSGGGSGTETMATRGPS